MNRLSFGMQSFDDGCLQRLGRIHDSGEADAAMKLAQDAGFDNFNLDLMYALPEQTLAMAERGYRAALALQPAHICPLPADAGAEHGVRRAPPAGIPDEDASWDMQEHCQALLAEAGFAQYEVSAYARRAAQCAHNLNYWHFGDYLGIGAGAHGKLTLGAEQTMLRRWKVKHPAEYLARPGTPAAIGGDEGIDRRGARSTTCSMRCAWSRVSRLGEFEAAHRPAARRRSSRSCGRPPLNRLDRRRTPPVAFSDRIRPALHQRRHLAVP